MKLTLLGTGNAAGMPVYGCECQRCTLARVDRSQQRSACSALLEVGEHRYLIDAGQLHLCERFPHGTLQGIFLTHFHPDHVQGLFELRWGVNITLPVYCPPDPQGCADLYKHPGILDFQDALEGPLTYDLVSLLKDCYIRFPSEEIRQRALDWYADLSEEIHAQVDEQQFWRYFDLMGAQRHLKAAGIFCRLLHRDGKTGYLKDVPRTLEYVAELAPQYEELDFVARLIRDRILPAWNDSA